MLRTRLFLYLTPFVVILLGIGVYAIVLFARLASSVDRLRDEHLPEFLRGLGHEPGFGGNGSRGVVGGRRTAPRRQKQPGGIPETFH